MPRTATFLGKGLAFNVRLNPVTGGLQTTTGYVDEISVALQYLNERFTIREDLQVTENHVAESIAHILLTNPGEHDTLPAFGSRIKEMLFEPNSQEFYLALRHYLKYAAARWEKRAKFVDIQWNPSGQQIDEGRAPVVTQLTFIAEQVSGNLVMPFITPREARLQEYPSSVIDSNSHGYHSRYYGLSSYTSQGYKYTRFPKSIDIPPARDDEFYRVKHGDTWLLIADEKYSDITLWPVIAMMNLQDKAKESDASRTDIDPCPDPEVGTLLRIPSRSRMLMSIVASS